ncbi:MAG: Asp-tRNA(Asn)/Glu-tRNA(Gln) amidotransferase subunit GatB [Candidatus Paceibacterota bacterium]
MKWQEKYKPVIGLEIHAELKTDSKMFCGCVNDPFSAEKPNSYTCPVCLGMPGGLPVPNKKAIEWTLKIGLATECQINNFSKFDRKHYFYPDLAKGYQISQYDLPFCYDGQMTVTDGVIEIRRIHLEEDTGKLLHTSIDDKKVTLVDFNRSGVPLVEIVTEPDITSGKQAKEFGKKIRQLLRFLEVADCDMEQGGMRLEANISLRKIGETALPNYKVEIKNINSFRFMEQAVDYELERQAKLLEAGETPIQETRGWDSVKNETFSQRSKEEAEDYRYFPEPDIPPFHFEESFIAEIRASLPDLPIIIAKKWQEKYALHPKQIEILLATDSKKKILWLEKVFALLAEKSLDNNLFANDFINKKIIMSSDAKPEEAVTSFEKLHATEKIDDTELKNIIQTVLKNNADAVAKYQAGQTQVIGFLIGQIMKNINKKIDPKVVRKALQTTLEAD